MAEITKIQLKTKTSSGEDVSLSDINLDLGEPLVDKNDKKVIIGGNAHEGGSNNTADNSTNIILGASRTSLGNVSNNSVKLSHIDNKERSSYTIKTEGAKLSKEGNTLTIDSSYILTKQDTTNGTTITLTDANSESQDIIVKPNSKFEQVGSDIQLNHYLNGQKQSSNNISSKWSKLTTTTGNLEIDSSLSFSLDDENKFHIADANNQERLIISTNNQLNLDYSDDDHDLTISNIDRVPSLTDCSKDALYNLPSGKYSLPDDLGDQSDLPSDVQGGILIVTRNNSITLLECFSRSSEKHFVKTLGSATDDAIWQQIAHYKGTDNNTVETESLKTSVITGNREIDIKSPTIKLESRQNIVGSHSSSLEVCDEGITASYNDSDIKIIDENGNTELNSVAFSIDSNKSYSGIRSTSARLTKLQNSNAYGSVIKWNPGYLPDPDNPSTPSSGYFTLSDDKYYYCPYIFSDISSDIVYNGNFIIRNNLDNNAQGNLHVQFSVLNDYCHCNTYWETCVGDIPAVQIRYYKSGSSFRIFLLFEVTIEDNYDLEIIPVTSSCTSDNYNIIYTPSLICANILDDACDGFEDFRVNTNDASGNANEEVIIIPKAVTTKGINMEDSSNLTGDDVTVDLENSTISMSGDSSIEVKDSNGNYCFIADSAKTCLYEPQVAFSENKNVFKSLKEYIVDLLYPIGSIYITTKSANPGTYLGGTWEYFAEGRTLIGVSSDANSKYSTVEKTFGNETVNIPLQTHSHKVDTLHDHTLTIKSSSVTIDLGEVTTKSLAEVEGGESPKGYFTLRGHEDRECISLCDKFGNTIIRENITLDGTPVKEYQKSGPLISYRTQKNNWESSAEYSTTDGAEYITEVNIDHTHTINLGEKPATMTPDVQIQKAGDEEKISSDCVTNSGVTITTYSDPSISTLQPSITTYIWKRVVPST